MDVYQAAMRRRMVRNYLDREVDHAAVTRIVEAAECAPSAGNTRGQRFIVITDPELRRRIAHAAGEDFHAGLGRPRWLSSAPVLVVVTVSPDAYRHRYAETDKTNAMRPDDWPVPYWWLDAGAAVGILLVAAVADGLAAGFLGSHAVPGLAELIEAEPGEIPVGVVTVGDPHPDDVSPASARRPPPPSRVRWMGVEGKSPPDG